MILDFVAFLMFYSDGWFPTFDPWELIESKDKRNLYKSDLENRGWRNDKPFTGKIKMCEYYIALAYDWLLGRARIITAIASGMMFFFVVVNG